MVLPLSSSQGVIRFGDFDADLRSGELRKHGIRIKLQVQPFQVLQVLLENAGQVVTREELQKKIWPADTFVDFDHGLNNAVKKLREALGDDPERPRFIETLSKRGYRFLGPVEVVSADGQRPAIAAGVTNVAKSGHSAGRWAAVGSAVIILLAVWIMRPNVPSPSPRVVAAKQITHDGLTKFRFLTDGARLYMREWDGTGNFVLVQGSVNGGETSLMPTIFTNIELHDISPDHSRLLIGSFAGTESEAPLWTLPLPSGAPQRLGEIVAHGACWSPDGRLLVFAKGQDLFLANSEGMDVHKLATISGLPLVPRFSPDGGRIRFTVSAPAQSSSAIWEVRADGSDLHPLFPGWHGSAAVCCGSWSSDGSYYFFVSGTEVWMLKEKQRFLHQRDLLPVQITSGPLSFSNPMPDQNGRRLFAVGEQFRGELVRYNSHSRQYTRYLSGISAGELDFTRDGEWVTYVSYPGRNLWRSRIDGSKRIQLTNAPFSTMLPRWSPDGSQILYSAAQEGKPWKLFLIPSKGGTPEELMPGTDYSQIDATWSPDGVRIAFGQLNAAAPVLILDLKTHQISRLPAPEGVFSPRWSPDGQHIAALSADSKKLMLFDFKMQKWSKWITEKGSIGFLTWSPDSRYLYYDETSTERPAFRRMELGKTRSELLLELRDFNEYSDSLIGAWTGLAPDGSPLFVRDLSTREIYLLDLDLP